MHVTIYPWETAGQAWATAEGLRSQGHSAEKITVGEHQYGYETDTVLTLPEGGSLKPYRVYAKLLWHFGKRYPRTDAFLLWQGQSLIPRHIDLKILKQSSKPVIAVFQGSEVRLRRVAEKNNPYFVRVYPHQERS